MGDFQLGCLLGQYDDAQSFDVNSVAIASNVNSWTLLANVGGVFTTNTHSSNQGVTISVFSKSFPGQSILYRYGLGNDMYARWFPDITTHNIQTDFWAKMSTASTSGELGAGIFSQINDLSAIIPFADNLSHSGVKTIVHSEAGNNPVFSFVTITDLDATTRELYIDDVITQIDPITLYPEISFQEKEQVIKTDHTTRGSERHTYVWGRNLAWSVPLRYISDSHANLINWWWENKFELAFTLDTSDAETIHVVRIANNTQPFGKRNKPHQDRWEGLLQLEGVIGSEPVISLSSGDLLSLDPAFLWGFVSSADANGDIADSVNGFSYANSADANGDIPFGSGQGNFSGIIT